MRTVTPAESLGPKLGSRAPWGLLEGGGEWEEGREGFWGLPPTPHRAGSAALLFDSLELPSDFGVDFEEKGEQEAWSAERLRGLWTLMPSTYTCALAPREGPHCVPRCATPASATAPPPFLHWGAPPLPPNEPKGSLKALPSPPPQHAPGRVFGHWDSPGEGRVLPTAQEPSGNFLLNLAGSQRESPQPDRPPSLPPPSPLWALSPMVATGERLLQPVPPPQLLDTDKWSGLGCGEADVMGYLEGRGLTWVSWSQYPGVRAGFRRAPGEDPCPCPWARDCPLSSMSSKPPHSALLSVTALPGCL